MSENSVPKYSVFNYYAVALQAQSSLKLSSGEGEITDSDVLCDPMGKPFIPGTTVAGVCRHFLEDDARISEKTIQDWFGYQSNKKDEGHGSRLIFLDANLIDTDVQVTARDGVRLEDHVAKTGAKFDYQLVDKGSAFLLRLEAALSEDESAPAFLKKLLEAIDNGDIRFGGKTSRGFGRMSVVKVYQRSIDLTQDIEAFLDFNWDSYQAWTEYTAWDREAPSDCYGTPITWEFDIPSFLAIRHYLDDGNTFEPLQDSQGNAIIPGTSWAGAFRHHISRVFAKAGKPSCGELFTRAAFGAHEDDKAEPNRSNVLFEETPLTGSSEAFLSRTRVAIDRFTGGASDGKLFTYIAAYEQTGKLIIRIRKDFEQAELARRMISLCLEELQEGLLTVGGLAAIGGGICIKKEEGEQQ